MKKPIKLTVNGDPHELYIDTRRTLLDLLRNEVGLLGAHRGCDEGECGACTVHIDGLPMNACLRLAVDLDGAEILTVEGVAQKGQMHPLQKFFVEKGGIQCGFCTPGFIMRALALLEENPRPDESEVRAALSGNLCRCTGFVKIVEAVLSTAEQLSTNN